MPFDPDAYLAKKKPAAEGGFDPDSYLAKKAATDASNEALVRKAIAPQFTRTESAAAGAAQGFGQNFLDELYGARKAVTDVLPLVGDHPVSAIGDRYRANRDEARQYYEQAEEENPGSFTTGGVLGGGASAFVPGYNLATKSGGIGARVLSGAATSGVAGVGASDSESLARNLEDGAVSALVGGGMTGGFGLIGTKLGKLGPLANEKAVKASGAMTKEFRQLRKSGFLQRQGQWLREKGVVTPLASLEDVAERSKILKENAGKIIGGIVDDADKMRGEAIDGVRKAIVGDGSRPATSEQLAKAKAVEDMINQEFGYNFNNVADKITDMIKRDENVASAKFHRERLESLADEFRLIAGRGVSDLRTGLRNKTGQRELLKDVDNLGERYKQEIYDVISDELDRAVSGFERLHAGVQKMYGKVLPESVDNAGNALPAPGALTTPMASMPAVPPGVPAPDAGQAVVDKFRAANQEYAAAATAQATAGKRLDNTMSNRDFGLTTSIAANAGLVGGGPVGAVAMGGINNFFRQYGSAIQANVYAKVAETVTNDAKVFGASAPMLREALQRGPRQFVVANYIAARRDPAAKARLEQYLGDPTLNPTGEQSSFRLTDPQMLADAREMISGDESMSSIEKAKLLSEINKRGALEVEMQPARETPRQAVPTVAPKGFDDLMGALKSVTGGDTGKKKREWTDEEVRSALDNLKNPKVQDPYTRTIPQVEAAKKGLDEWLANNVSNPLAAKGHPNLGAGLATIPSVLTEILMPSSMGDMAGVVLPFRKGIKVVKEAAASKTAKVAETGFEKYLSKLDDDSRVREIAEKLSDGTEPYVGFDISMPVWRQRAGDVKDLPTPVPADFKAIDPKGHLGKSLANGGPDPFAWMDTRYGVTKQVLSDNYDKPLKISTRSDLVAHDDYMEHINPAKHSVEFRVFSQNNRINRAVLPGAPSLQRIATAIKKLQEAGVKVNIVHEVIPGWSKEHNALDVFTLKNEFGIESVPIRQQVVENADLESLSKVTGISGDVKK